ncbi:SGNH/GDSL hydrolase family protein [Burkholderia gladioli]|uniref:SGNH/GDSL hydrolase family protein n=2 Tax=Burkholderia gladioli TaxID=28095 RepID=UPI0016422433|nr:SGNH/GDSL hydrolase family protein [Burkholderia gladioli]MDN7601563.1 SGNH/GDSL hydrolase family protein [Burkholderia gladioli]
MPRTTRYNVGQIIKVKGSIAMKGTIASLLGMFVVSSIACGSGCDSAEAHDVSTTVLIESYGDSTTQGWQVENGVGQVTRHTAPLVLQTLLQDHFGPSVRVSNLGVGGTQASQLLNGTDGVHPDWERQMAASRAQIVTLNFGLNDAYYISARKDGIAAESPDDFAAVMTRLIQVARRHGKQVIVFEPNPTCEPIRQPRISAYVAALRRVARAQKVPIVGEFDAIGTMPNWASLLSDCLHPTDHGYAVKARLEFPVVAAAVQVLR